MKEKNKRKEYGRELKTEKEGSKTRKSGKVKMKCQKRKQYYYCKE